jgi:hypothetical protein
MSLKRLLNISLLSLFLVIASIAEVRSHTISYSDVAEVTMEVEDLSAPITPNIFKLVLVLFFIKKTVSRVSLEESSSLTSTIPQLLCSHRIALPPPLLS